MVLEPDTTGVSVPRGCDTPCASGGLGVLKVSKSPIFHGSRTPPGVTEVQSPLPNSQSRFPELAAKIKSPARQRPKHNKETTADGNHPVDYS